jgi:multicomponent Na+:H+ antiporter subunit E
MPPTSSLSNWISTDGESEAPSPTKFPIGFLALSALWVALAGYEDWASWLIGLPTILAAAWSYSRLSLGRNNRVSMVGVLQLLPVFFWESFRGGFDVARRVLRLRPKINPGLFDYRLNLSSSSARVFFVDLVSLLPGTLSADIRGDRMRIHTLDLTQNSVTELGRLERRVAAVFGQTLPDKAIVMR